MTKPYKFQKKKICSWCGRVGIRGFSDYTHVGNRVLCANGVACAERARKRDKFYLDLEKAKEANP